MILWRISNYKVLDGEGGMFAPGRWHAMPRQVVYTSDHPASALLEMLVRMNPLAKPKFFQLLKIKVPGNISPKSPARLPENWRNDTAFTRREGSKWLDRQQSAILKVPSAIIPEASNFLINPLHPQASRIRVIDVISVPLDNRFR